MKIRPIAVSAVLSWIAAECWAAPWHSVFWPLTHKSVLLGVFSALFLFGLRHGSRELAADVALLSIASAVGASFAWNLWMFHGWFNWSWLHWLPSATGSDGEGSYRMIEYEFFLIIFLIATGTWLVVRSRARPQMAVVA